MHFQPTPCDGELQASAVFRWRTLVAEQERAVELLDIDAAFLNRLEGVRVLQQTTSGFLRIGVGAFGGAFHRSGCGESVRACAIGAWQARHQQPATDCGAGSPLVRRDLGSASAGGISDWPQARSFLIAGFDLMETPSRIDLFRTPLGVRPIAFTICSRVFPDPASSDRRRSSL